MLTIHLHLELRLRMSAAIPLLPPLYLHDVHRDTFYGSQNESRLFPNTALTNRLCNRDGVFTARYGLGL